jgi:hypothetical protein
MRTQVVAFNGSFFFSSRVRLVAANSLRDFFKENNGAMSAENWYGQRNTALRVRLVVNTTQGSKFPFRGGHLPRMNLICSKFSAGDFREESAYYLQHLIGAGQLEKVPVSPNCGVLDIGRR